MDKLPVKYVPIAFKSIKNQFFDPLYIKKSVLSHSEKKRRCVIKIQSEFFAL